jgi:hypothetical protein
VRYDFSDLTATKSYKQLQKVTNSYKERQTVTKSYKKLQKATRRREQQQRQQGRKEQTNNAGSLSKSILTASCPRELSMLVVTEAAILRKGLKWAGFNRQRQGRVKLETNRMRFRAFYGSDPIVYAVLLHDLQTTDLDEARIELDEDGVKPFFLAISWLYSYYTEAQLAGRFGYCERTCRKYLWFFARKIRALKEQKVRLCQRHTSVADPKY